MKKDDLRRRAEARLRVQKKTAPLAPVTEAEALRLVHELQVHQIELEMQNEEVMQARAGLETALSQYTELYDYAPVGYFTLARDGAIRQVNLTGARLLHVDRGQLMRRRLGVFVSEGSRTAFNAFLERIFESQRVETCDVALMTEGSDPFWARIEASLAESEPGRRDMCRAVLADISAARRAQEALRQSEEHFRNLAQALPDAVYTLELPARRMIYFNHDSFLGYSRAELMADISILSPLQPDGDGAAGVQGEPWVSPDIGAPIELRISDRAGAWEWVQRREVVQARDADGTPTQILTILSLITERKRAAEFLRDLSIHDALTGLYNRAYFDEELGRLERGREYPVSVVIVDVDRLKATNDQWGHAAGDALLKRVAQVLTAAFRTEDVVTRIGGDEFAVLLPGASAAAVEGSRRRVQQLIQENNAAHPATPIYLSVGVSTAEQRTALAGVLAEADADVYREKRGHDVA